MKLDRLMGILTILLKNEKVTAPYLAEKFEVSRRTISRDLDSLSMAGIPIITFQGNSGGISIDETFKIDKQLFTSEELKSILIGLQSLDSICVGSKYKHIAEKIETKKFEPLDGGSIKIDLSSHYKNTIAPKIEAIQTAIFQKRLISFDYIYKKGEEIKEIEPYWIIFKWSSWYVFGFSLDKQDFRHYKLNRLWNLQIDDLHFESRFVPEEKAEIESFYIDQIKLIAKFDNLAKYRLVEEYGLDCFSNTDDGRLFFCRFFTDKEYLLEWILSFGSRVEIIEPNELRDEIIIHSQNILKLYTKHDA
jgi:predicted DNA-binding transcriptional regulator YafY